MKRARHRALLQSVTTNKGGKRIQDHFFFYSALNDALSYAFLLSKALSPFCIVGSSSPIVCTIWCIMDCSQSSRYEFFIMDLFFSIFLSSLGLIEIVQRVILCDLFLNR